MAITQDGQKIKINLVENDDGYFEKPDKLNNSDQNKKPSIEAKKTPEQSVETSAERANTDKLKVKIKSKQEGANISLNVLESKVEYGRYYDSDSPAEIASINPWKNFESVTDEAENNKIAESAATFGAALSVLMKVGIMKGVDVSTPQKLIEAVRSPNFPITPNATELTAITKLDEIYKAEGSQWKNSFKNEYWGALWGNVVNSEDSAIPGLPESKIHSPATNIEKEPAAQNLVKGNAQVMKTGETAIQNPTIAKPQSAESVGDKLEKMWDLAKENPGTALLYTGIAVAAICGIYKLIKSVVSDDSKEEGEKSEGGLGGKVLKYLLGAGAVGGGAYGLFRLLSGSGESAVLDQVTQKMGVAKDTAEAFLDQVKKGEIKEALYSLVIGMDKDNAYHDAAAKKIRSEVKGAEVLNAQVLFAYKDKNFTDFVSTRITDNVDTLNELSDKVSNGLKGLPIIGRFVGVYGLDGAGERKATDELKAYFKKNEDELHKNFHYDPKTATVGEILRMLLPPGSPALSQTAGEQSPQTPPPLAPVDPAKPESNEGAAAAKAAVVAGGTAAATVISDGELTEQQKPETAKGVSQDTDDESEAEVPWASVDSIFKTYDNSYDNKKTRESIIETYEKKSKYRERLVTNESLLDGMPSWEDLDKAIKSMESKAASLGKLKKKTSPEDWGPIDEKLEEINKFKKEMIKLIPQNETAASNYLTAIRSGDDTQVQNALAEMTIVKNNIKGVLEDALTREGWAFLEQMMAVHGVNIGRDFYKNWLNADDLRTENAKYLFGNAIDTVKSFIGGSSRRLNGGGKNVAPFTLDELETNITKIHTDIEGLEKGVHTKHSADEEVGEDFFKTYKNLEKNGAKIRNDLEIRLNEADKKLASAVAASDTIAADEAMKELNRCYKASANFEAGVTHDLVGGWQRLGSKFGPVIHGKKPISIGQIIETSMNQKGYEGGIQQLRATFRSCIRRYKHKEGFSLWNHLKPTKKSIGIYGMQMALGGYLLSDDQTTFTEGVKQSALMASPVVGTYLDAKQAITGQEAFTDRPLDGTDRAISGAFAIAGGASDILSFCGLGFMGRTMIDGLKTAKGLNRLRRAELMLTEGTDAYKMLKATKAYKLNQKIHMGMAAMAIGVVGSQVIKGSIEKLAEVTIPEGFYNEIAAPIKGEFGDLSQKLDSKYKKVMGE